MSLNFYTIDENNTKINELKEEYNTFSYGKIILAPSCIGKSTFLKSQSEKNWVDTDVIMSQLGLDWHYNEEDDKQMILNYRIADFYLAQLKLQGFQILGSLFWEFTPDAIVIPPWKKHKKMLANRKKQFENNEINFVWKQTNEDVKKNRKFLRKFAKKRKIPIFKSIEKAINCKSI
tara:strand:+ start:1169 stop:1696 length:528 start_codon:yes stop_codon:yes gene_type:complete